MKFLLRLLCQMDAHYVPEEHRRWNGVFWEAHCPTCNEEVWFDESEGWKKAPTP